MKSVQKKLRNYVAFLLAIVLFVNGSVSSIGVIKAQAVDENSQHAIIELEKVRIEYSLVSQWTGGYQACISITNISQETIHNWYLISDITPNFSDIWNAELFVSTENGCIIKNADYNQDILAGETVSFGYCVKEEFKGYPTTYELRSGMKKENSEDYDFTYHIDKEWEDGFSGTITITNQSETILEDWLITFEYSGKITNVWEAVMERKDSTHYVIRNAGYNGNIASGQSISFGFSAVKGTVEELPFNYQIFSYGDALETDGKVDLPLNDMDIDYTDDDEDGLPNFFEEAIHSDENNIDSDGDGLPDGYEIFTTLTDPTKADSDDNGILDGEEDNDQDGLSNLREYELVIDPEDPDTDGDGLSDLSELMYSMNPNDKDSLDDGILDGERVFDIEQTGELSDNQAMQPHLSLKLRGDQVDSFCMEKLPDNDPFFNEDIPGYMGNGYEFTVDGSIEEALLSFEFSEEIEKDSAIQPCIYYWNEQTQLLEEVEGQFWEEDKLCAKLSHFSRYIVLSKNMYEEGAFSCVVEAPKDVEQIKGTFDVAFVLDESGSIDSDDYYLMKDQCVELMERLADKDRVSIFAYSTDVRKVTTFTDLETAKREMKDMWQHEGLTASYQAIYEAAMEFSTDSCDDMAKKIMILVTDGNDNWSKIGISVAIDKAVEQDIAIYTIGVGSSVDEDKLSSIAKQTGGEYFGIEEFAQLNDVFKSMVFEYKLYRDSDGDGISDYHEKMIAEGKLCLGTGQPLQNYMQMDYLCADSDGDGLLDGEEVTILEIGNSGNYFCFLFSNPCVVDTDSDGVEDNWENYIGTSAIAMNVSKKSNSKKKDGLSIGWDEWQKMRKKYSWGYIHSLVQEDITNKYEKIVSEFAIRGVGRADLYHVEDKKVWEVKPLSYATDPYKTKGIEQLKRYVKAIKGASIGDGEIKAGVFMSPGFEYKVVYNNMKNGLIIYYFTKNLTTEMEAKKKKEEKKEEEKKEKDYEYKPQIAASEQKYWNYILAIIIAGGTIAEDVATGGAGIADDAASFYFSYKLIFG